VNKQQGHLPADKNDGSKLYRLTLTKEELGAVHLAMQIDFETLSELLRDDTEWERVHTVVVEVLDKIRELEIVSGFNASALGAKSE
jgi:hypothetical protein